MAGKKDFKNNTDGIIGISLFIRAGEDPKNGAGVQTFTLKPRETQSITYGNDQNIYLNGYNLVSDFNGAHYCIEEFVTNRGSAFDNLLNTNSKVEINYNAAAFQVTTNN
jgi:hypothetical protein